MATNRRNWNSDLQNKAVDYLNEMQHYFEGESGGYFLDFIDSINDEFNDMLAEKEELENKIHDLEYEIVELNDVINEI